MAYALYIGLSEWHKTPDEILGGMTDEQLAMMMEQRSVDIQDKNTAVQGGKPSARAKRLALTRKPMVILRRKPRGLKE